MNRSERGVSADGRGQRRLCRWFQDRFTRAAIVRFAVIAGIIGIFAVASSSNAAEPALVDQLDIALADMELLAPLGSSVFDLNADGVVDFKDLAISEAQAVGTSPCKTADFDSDGKCTIVDVQMLVLASQGQFPIPPSTIWQNLTSPGPNPFPGRAPK